MAHDQRISYLPLEAMDDEMRAEMERCQREGTPRPESSAVRAHVPACFWAFARSWEAIFRDGVCDHAIKELCRVYVSRSVKCEYCGNQRSEKARTQGLAEGQYDDLLNFETSEGLGDRQKAALAYAEAITWRLEADDALWDRLYRHFSEPELVELGCFIALTMGQQSWLRLLNIEHHEVLAGTTASMAPGFGTPAELATSKASADYWARETASQAGGGDDGLVSSLSPIGAQMISYVRHGRMRPMTELDEHGRPEPPVAADEVATLLGFLDYQRATLAWKCSGLDAAGLRATTAASVMTLGGILKHMALVENGWFSGSLHGRGYAPPWNAVDWKADPDWEWRTAAEDSPEELFALWQRAVEQSRADVAEVLDSGDGLGRLAKRTWPDGRSPSLRWILCHMIEEYARHNGHADLLRESIDGATGE